MKHFNTKTPGVSTGTFQFCDLQTSDTFTCSAVEVWACNKTSLFSILCAHHLSGASTWHKPTPVKLKSIYQAFSRKFQSCRTQIRPFLRPQNIFGLWQNKKQFYKSFDSHCNMHCQKLQKMMFFFQVMRLLIVTWLIWFITDVCS